MISNGIALGTQSCRKFRIKLDYVSSEFGNAICGSHVGNTVRSVIGLKKIKIGYSLKDKAE